jgi:energy-coupling factor transporter transmembrane protein EcfT
MAILNPFEFRPGTTSLHCLDTRCKFFLVCIMSLSLVNAGFSACFIALGVLYCLLKQIRLKIIETIKQLKYFILFLFFLILTRSLTMPGDPIVTFHDIVITRQGLFLGCLVALRFFLVMVTGLLFSATTRAASIKTAAQWYLKPLPFVPEKRVAIMISLALRFLPLILKQARENSNAIQSRCGNLQKNPVKRFIRLSLPVLKKTFLSADHLILAMEARCYCENRTDPEFEPGGKEVIFIITSLVLSFCIIFW